LIGDTLQDRYNRQVLFPPIGREGQVKLTQSRVAIIGMGALGTVLATQLVRAGVGFVRLIDRDIVETSNLQRQALYDEDDAEQSLPKVIAAQEKLVRANRDVEIEALVADLTWRNAEPLLADVDVIVDGSDNFQVRYLINDVAVKHGIPWSYGGAVSSYGTTGFIRPGITPCLVCLFGRDHGGGHATCDTVGVIAPIVSIIASFQVAETLKYLTGNAQSLASGLIYVDAWTTALESVEYPPRNPDCPCCSMREFPSLAVQADTLAISMCGRNTIQVRPHTAKPLDLKRVAQRLKQMGEVRQNAFLLQCHIHDDLHITLFQDGRALIHGTDDPVVAKNTYARYVGM
jgi:molybdopterin-synthase adenylyltransferase